MSSIKSVASLAEFGRSRLSKNFFMRDFLYSEVANLHGIPNVPDDPDLALRVGRHLCEELLEPLNSTFGRIAIRSAFRSATVNGFCNAMQKQNKKGYTCASNTSTYAAHIWDHPDRNGRIGAMACIVIPWFADRFEAGADWRSLAWYIHDQLPYDRLEFFPRLCAFNISWSDRPVRSIYSYIEPKGYLTRVGMPGHDGDHAAAYFDFPPLSRP